MPPQTPWEIFVEPYTNLIGNFFWAVLLFIMLILVWMKTQSFGPTFLTLVVGLAILSLWIPGDIHTIFMFTIAIGVAYTFYRLLFRSRVY